MLNYLFRVFVFRCFCCSLHRQRVCKPRKQKQYRVLISDPSSPSAHLFLFSSPPLLPVFLLTAASSFSFCRASLEHTVSAEELSYQLPRRAGGSNLTWHDGRGQKTAHTRTVKLLQQPGTEGIQVKRRPHKRTRGIEEEYSLHLKWLSNVIFLTE